MLNYLYLFFIGTFIGSYFSSLVFEDTKLLITKRRSKCQKCKNKLKSWMLVPVFSYLAVSGRCHYCKEDISMAYPLLELITGASFVLLSLNYTYDLSQIFILSTMALFIASSFSDQKNLEISNTLIYSTLTFGLIYMFLNFNSDLIYGFITGGLFFEIQRYISKGKWVGQADAYFAATIGCLMGFELTILTIFLSYWLATIYVIPKLLSRSINMKSKLPFIPFLTLSFFLVNFFYDIIVINLNYF